jgi:APA family basic amino acid/polyamine antiporter
MVSKILVISLLIGGGLILNPTRPLNWMPIFESPISGHLLKAGAAAMVPVLFTYSGWPSAGFVSGEVRDPRRNMPLATVLGVAGVVVLYCLVTLVDVRVLGVAQLSKTSAPASAVMRVVLGEKGAAIIAVGIMISALGYISQATLTAPRVYYAMAQDGLFFKSLVWLPRKTRVPVLAILLQGACSIVIAFSGRYDQILNYVMSVEFVFLFLTGVSLFIFRGRTAMAAREGVIGPTPEAAYEMPGHPLTTLFFMTVCGLSALNMFYTNLINSLIGWGIVLVGIPVYFLWQWRNSRVQESALRKVTPSS